MFQLLIDERSRPTAIRMAITKKYRKRRFLRIQAEKSASQEIEIYYVE